MALDMDALGRRFDEHHTETKGLITGVDGKLTKVAAKANEVDARLVEIEQKMARRGSGGDIALDTWGSSVAKSTQLKRFLSEMGGRGTVSVEVKAITSLAASAGAMIAPDRQVEPVMLPHRPLTVRKLLQPGKTVSGVINYIKQTGYTNAASVVSDGADKPESDLTFTEAESNVRTIAHWIHVHRNTLDDAPLLESTINGELSYGLDEIEETELLKGSGVGNHLNGIWTQATNFSRTFTPESPNRLDDIRVAILQAQVAKYPVTGIIMHPTAWAHIETTKDTTGQYLDGVGPFASGPPSLWRRPVVETLALDEGEFMVGAFGLAAQIFDRLETEILISSEDRDNFIKNMLTIRAEKRLALVVRRPEALIRGNFQTTT